MKHLLVFTFAGLFCSEAYSQVKPLKIAATDAAKHIGEYSSVKGDIHGLKVAKDSVLFYLSQFKPNQSITIVLTGEALASYQHTNPNFKFTHIAANGKIIELENKPAIVVSNSRNYQLLGDR